MSCPIQLNFYLAIHAVEHDDYAAYVSELKAKYQYFLSGLWA